MTSTAPHMRTPDEVFEVNGTRFHPLMDSNDYTAEESTIDAFVLVKPRAMVDQMVQLVDELKPDRIVELGIFKGGSAALLASLRPTAQITAVDITPLRVAALDRFIRPAG